jgi:hypothetical protein
MSLTHFGIDLLHSGLSDQLAQLDVLYRVGRSLGLRYLHSPLNDGHGDNFHGYEMDTFLGLSRGEERLSLYSWQDPKTSPQILRLTPRPVPPTTVSLIDWVRHCVSQDYREGQTVLMLDPRENQLALWGSVWGGHSRIWAGLQPTPFQFRRKYWEQRLQWPMPDGFSPGSVWVAVHIRLGTMKLLTFNNRRFAGAREIAAGVRPPSYTQDLLAVAVYRELLHALIEEHPPGSLSIRVFSDGYASTYRLAESLPWSAEQQAELAQQRRRDERELYALCELPGVQLQVAGSLYETVHSLAIADVVLWGSGHFVQCTNAFGRNMQRQRFHVVQQRQEAQAYVRKLVAGNSVRK